MAAARRSVVESVVESALTALAVGSYKPLNLVATRRLGCAEAFRQGGWS
jgi:hypothetical protein